MKKLILFAIILLSSLVSYSQDEVVGPDPGTGPNPNPNFICGSPYCFINTTGCYVSVGIDIQGYNEICQCDFGTPWETLYLQPGESGCIEAVVCENGCVLCPSTYFFNICGSNGAPCFPIGQTETGGQGEINCGGGPYQAVYWHWDPATARYIITQ